MELKQIDNNIRRVRTNSGKWNKLVHDTAVAIVEHAKEHGDCTRALKLVQAMPASVKRSALINWFAEYSPITMNVKKAIVRLNKNRAGDYNLDGARVNPWYEIAEAEKEELPDTTLVDVRDMLDKLAKRIDKRVTDGKIAANDKERIVTMQKAIAKLAVA